MITYEVRISQKSPLDGDTMNKLGKEGYLLVGVVRTATEGDGKHIYPYEEFWYYFIYKSGIIEALRNRIDVLTGRQKHIPQMQKVLTRILRSQPPIQKFQDIGDVSKRLRDIAHR